MGSSKNWPGLWAGHGAGESVLWRLVRQSRSGEGDVSGFDLHKKLPGLLQQLRGCKVAAERAGRGRCGGTFPGDFRAPLPPLSLAPSPTLPSRALSPPSPLETPFELRPGNSLLFLQ